MSILHSDVFGRKTRDAQVYERESMDDHVMVEWDGSGRLHDIHFAPPLPPSRKISNENHTMTTFEPPFHGLSVHQGKSIQWMFWNETDFRDLRFHGSQDQINVGDLWLGKEYEIFRMTVFRSWGRIVGFSVSAKQIIISDVEVHEENDREHDVHLDDPEETHNPDEHESVEASLTDGQSSGVPIAVTVGGTHDTIASPFFFSDDHIWYIQIALYIFAAFIIAITLCAGLLR